jgi:nucleotide-binding universal stress UspA family protein
MHPRDLFSRIVVGVDGTPQSLEAVRQALRLGLPGGKLTLIHALNLVPALAVSWSVPRFADEGEAKEALEEAAVLAPDATRRVVAGSPVSCLMEEIENGKATLVAVGTHGTSRPEGIVLGGVATTMLHEAPCAVLVARQVDQPYLFPQAIAVGVDGSPQSTDAAAVATDLAQRFGARLRGVIAAKGKDVDVEAARAALPEIEVDRRREPVAALTEAARDVDLLVLGNRGLHGIRALGSVSERVAHRAECSVLVVRGRT